MSKVIHSVAFLGLGAMGYRMAAHLPKQFQDVRVWNRTSSKAEQHAAQYHTQAVSLHDALQADVIISCLPTSQDVEQLIITAKENGAFNTANAGKIWIDCTSGVPDDAKRIRQILSPYGIDFLDAPVSGQTIGAENATLTFMVG
ncbi:MAG: NAD(P)-binding domain-containing protein, partial [Acinetobacter sp.]|nr:NAD(P)-binding domain-containing protein [Acinetobacter sp.]